MKPFTMGECWGLAYCYMFLGGAIHMAFGTLCTAVLVVLGLLRRRPMLLAVARLWVFLCALLVAGCFWNGIWNVLVFNRLY